MKTLLFTFALLFGTFSYAGQDLYGNLNLYGDANITGNINNVALTNYVNSITNGLTAIASVSNNFSTLSQLTNLTTSATNTLQAFTLTSISGTTSDVLNVRSFGAIGDGSHDDTPNIQSTMDQAMSQHKICFLPYGFFLVSHSLKITNGISMLGNGTGNSFIFSTNNIPIITMDVSVNQNYNSHLSKLTLVTGATATTSNNIGIYFTGNTANNGPNNCIFEDLLFLGTYNCFYSDKTTGTMNEGTDGNIFNNIRCANWVGVFPVNGFYWKNGSGTANIFNNLSLQVSNGCGMAWNGADGGNIGDIAINNIQVTSPAPALNVTGVYFSVGGIYHHNICINNYDVDTAANVALYANAYTNIVAVGLRGGALVNVFTNCANVIDIQNGMIYGGMLSNSLFSYGTITNSTILSSTSSNMVVLNPAITNGTWAGGVASNTVLTNCVVSGNGMGLTNWHLSEDIPLATLGNVASPGAIFGQSAANNYKYSWTILSNNTYNLLWNPSTGRGWTGFVSTITLYSLGSGVITGSIGGIHYTAAGRVFDNAPTFGVNLPGVGAYTTVTFTNFFPDDSSIRELQWQSIKTQSWGTNTAYFENWHVESMP